MFDRAMEWVRENVAEGKDIEEFVKLLPRPADLIKSDPDIKSEFDRQVSYAVENHDKRFRDEKLPTILDEEREKIRKELNPEETAEQREIRELKEQLAKDRAVVQKRDREAMIRKKAAELGVSDIGLSPEDVEPFVVFGDDAPSVLESFVSKTKDAWTKSLDAKVKERYKGSAPSSSNVDMDEVERLRAAGDVSGAERAQLKGIYEQSKRPE